MSNQFKPGDPALTLVDRCGIPAMSQVDIVEFVEAGTVLKTVKGKKASFSCPVWRCAIARIVDGDLIFRDKELMPLRGDFVPDQQKSKEAEPCA